MEGELLGRTKKCRSEREPLLVSKKQFLRRYKRISKSKCEELTYAECKALSSDYREKSLQFKMVMGQWSVKDENLQSFV